MQKGSRNTIAHELTWEDGRCIEGKENKRFHDSDLVSCGFILNWYTIKSLQNDIKAKKIKVKIIHLIFNP